MFEEIMPWRKLYEDDQDSNENGLSSFSPDSYMDDEIELRRQASIDLCRAAFKTVSRVDAYELLNELAKWHEVGRYE